jgi:hypothetical protein
MRGVSYPNAMRRVFIRKFDVTDFLNLPLQSETVERIDPEARENLDAIFQLAANSKKEPALLLDGSFEGGRIRHSPMRTNRLPGPHGTLLSRCLVAYRKNKIEVRAVGHSEFIPAL